MRRLWIRLAIVAAAGALTWGLWRTLDTLHVRGELLLARKEISEGRFESARNRLSSLASARPRAMGGQVDYWLGVSESSLGRIDAALTAFARLPADYVFDARASYLDAEANLQRGRLHAAERRLEAALARGGTGLNEVRRLLSRVYEIQLRADDSLPLYRDSLAESQEPFLLLQRVSTLDGGTLPLDSLRETLDEAARLAPEDDRVWLGKARLAMQMGEWDIAESWIRRCLSSRPDVPVYRAWLDWARGTGQPGEALQAIQAMGLEQLAPTNRLAIRAWFSRVAGDVKGERNALTRWLELEPRSIAALERLSALAHQAGETDLAGTYRRRKSEIDRALDRYRLRVRLGSAHDFQSSASRIEIGKLAETAGLIRDAGAWYRLVLNGTPQSQEANDALTRIDGELARLRRDQGSSESTDQSLATLAELARQAARSASSIRSAASAPASEISGGSAANLSFIDEAEASGLQFVYKNGESKIHQIPETTGGGVALVDYDGDGWLDVYAVQGGDFPPLSERPSSGDRLFRNRGNGTFEDVTEKAGLTGLSATYGHGVTVGDYDNDGHPDLFLTRWRAYKLFRNRGNGTFEDVTEKTGLGGDRDWPTSAAFADLDGDGDLDLYVCHYGVWNAENPKLCRNEASGAYISCNPLELEARPDHLFRNDGGRFVDVTEQSGVLEHDGRGLGVLAADLDEDGRIDLYVANDLTANYLWRNLGGLKFEEVGHSAGVAGSAGGGYQASMGIAAGDLDQDGRIDLAVTNFYGECTTFYRNLGGGVFSDSTTAIGLDVATRRLLGFGIAFLDVNNDGRLDLASANGHVNDLRPHFPYLMPAQLLLGGAGGKLIDVSDRAGTVWKVPRMARGLAAGDLDNDGRADVLLLGHNTPLAYLHNRGAAGHYVAFALEGTDKKSNRNAIGARVTVLAGGSRRVAWRVGGGSYQSACDPRLHFGLGGASRIDSVEIVWPSGHVDRYQDLPADSGYLLREGAAAPSPLLGFARSGSSSTDR